MTKPLVQGIIGYYRNGELVHMPSRRKRPSSEQRINAHEKRNKERRSVLLQRKNDVQRAAMKKKSIQYPMDDLKNASKIGSVCDVLCAIKGLFTYASSLSSFSSSSSSSDQFAMMVRFLFLHDIEERSAIYYASLTGHAQLVKFYMCLYLMSVFRLSDNNKELSLTFREWFCHYFGTRRMGLIKKFNLDDYDLCVLNSLNEETRQVLTKKKISIITAVQFVKQVMMYSSSQSRKTCMNLQHKVKAQILKIQSDMERAALIYGKKKKHKKPRLNCEDELDNFDTEDLLYDDEEDEVEEEEDNNESSHFDEYDEEDEIGQRNVNDGNSCASEITESTQDTDLKKTKRENDLNACDYSKIERTGLKENDKVFKMDEEKYNVSSPISFSFTFLKEEEKEKVKEEKDDTDVIFVHGNRPVEDDIIVVNAVPSPRNTIEEDWDIISKVESIKTFDSCCSIDLTSPDVYDNEYGDVSATPVNKMSPSYRDILVRGETTKAVVKERSITNRSISKEWKNNTDNQVKMDQEEHQQMSNIKFNDHDDDDYYDYDSISIRNGIKGCRGGKSKWMFRGNRQTFRNYQCRCRSSCYQCSKDIMRARDKRSFLKDCQ